MNWPLFFMLLLESLSGLHVHLLRFRVLGVSVTAFGCYGAFDAYVFYKQHYTEFDSFGPNTGIGLVFLTFIGLAKYGFENVQKRHER